MCVVRISPVLGTGTASLSVASRYLSRRSAASARKDKAPSGANQTEVRLQMRPTYAGVDSDMRADLSWQAGLFS